MPHFFINSNSVKDTNIIVDDKDNYQHIVKSLRSKVGEKIKFIDENEIVYNTRVSSIDKTFLTAEIIDKTQSSRKLGFELYLAQSPLRSDAQTTIIEKATELGVTGVYPIYTDNCAVKKNIINQKIDKWQNVMYAASKQCERANIPTCFNLTTLNDVVSIQKFDKILALCEHSTDMSIKDYFNGNHISDNQKILIIIGPEGGFSDAEFKFFEDNSIPKLSLGNLILKAETAVITTIGNIIYEFNG